MFSVLLFYPFSETMLLAAKHNITDGNFGAGLLSLVALMIVIAKQSVRILFLE